MAVFRRCHLAAARLRPGTAASALTVAPSTAAMGFADPWHLPAARAGLASSVPPSTLTSTGNDRHEDDDHHTRPVAAVAAPRFRRRRRAATCPAAAPCRAGRRRLRGRRPSRPPGRAALVRAGPRAPGRNRASYLASSLLPQSGTGHRLPEIPEPLSGIPQCRRSVEPPAGCFHPHVGVAVLWATWSCCPVSSQGRPLRHGEPPESFRFFADDATLTLGIAIPPRPGIIIPPIANTVAAGCIAAICAAPGTGPPINTASAGEKYSCARTIQ